MTAPSPASDSTAWRFGAAAAFGAVFAYLLHRNLGLNPAIFADEWYYSKMARLLPLDEAILPSYLYLWIFRASNACGDGFLDCVRIGNALFFVGAAPFIYLTAREVSGKWLALLVALMAILAPINLFTVFFMPESTYYFGFWVLSWIALTKTGWGRVRYALVTGAVLGLLSLVKVHALFLLPALCVFLLYLSWSRGGRWLRPGLQAAALATLALLAVRFGLGYLLAGDTALGLFGSLYSGTAATRPPLPNMLAPAFIIGRGHLMALAVLLALPLAILAHGVLRPPARTRAGDRRNLLLVYALLMLGAALAMTVAFTASIAHHGPNEVLRLHMRYYAFVFPLLIMVAAAWPQDDRAGPAWLRWTLALGLAALIVLAVIKLPLYALNAIDGPEITAIDMKSRLGRLAIGLDLLALLLWARRSALARPLFVFGALPVMLASGSITTTAYVAQLKSSWPPEQAGKFAHAYVPKAEHKFITVAANNVHELLRAQFHIDDKDVALLEVPRDQPIARYQLPVHNKWLLVVGRHALPDGIKPVVATADYALVRLNPTTRRIGAAQLSQPFGSGLIASAEGLSPPEPWGRWSEAKQVVIHFNAPLPRRLVLVLKGRSFGPNETLPFTLRVGASSTSFRLGTVVQEVGLRLDTDGRQRSVTIEVPQPVSPAELGLSTDVRKLGIGLAAIEVGSAAEAVTAAAD